MQNFEKLYKRASEKYSPINDFPALAKQYENWCETKPLSALKVLDTTPVFENTFPKYAALLSAGAELFVCDASFAVFDKSVISALGDYGIKLSSSAPNEKFDIILDCGGFHSESNSTYGFSELTRTGAIKYENTTKKVFVADNSITKEFETTLGTGDGFARAIEKLGKADVFKKTILVFGCGKVGRGVVMACAERGAKVISVDVPMLENVALKFGASEFVDMNNTRLLFDALQKADCIVSATGVKGAVKIPSEIANMDGKIFANMGVEDEFGDSVAPQQALNGKKPLNFILKEPTQLRFIDPTLALHNYGATELLSDKLKIGANKPSAEIEKLVLDCVPQDLLKKIM